LAENLSRINGFDTTRRSAYVIPMDRNDQAADKPSVFDATLKPHRSLEPRGFLLLMAVVAGISFVSGMAFVLHGAWPVMGFFGLDAVAVYIAFRINYRAADASERVVLSETELLVERHRRGRLIGRWTFQPYWLRIELGDEPRTGVILQSHGRSIAVGTFLSPDEQAGFAQALKHSLAELRTAPHLRP
jgi:uncharacterized membrane protein